jgi:hypothetical protein
MSANDKQIAGSHYQTPIQVWDFIAANELDWFQGTIVKYITRWRHKGGIDDLLKAQHVLEKYIEVQCGTKTHNP